MWNVREDTVKQIAINGVVNAIKHIATQRFALFVDVFITAARKINALKRAGLLFGGLQDLL